MESTRTNPQVLLDEGLRRGLERCRRDMPPPQEWLAEKAIDTCRSLLSSDAAMDLWSEWPDRAALIYLELVVVGTYARVLNQEPVLAISDLKPFADSTMTLLNSWFHE